jgi:hypothetical protein
MRSSAVTLVAGVLAIGLVGCATSKSSSSKSQPSGFVAYVGYRSVETKVAVRRWKAPLALGVVVGQKVQDQFTVEPSLHMANHYTEYRKTIGAALQRVFGENFANVAVADKESGSGLELVVTRAEMQPSMTIKFGLSLLQNGRELLDVVGESEGKTVAMRGNRDTLFEKYDGAIEEVTDFALASFAEKVYDAVMRSKKLEADGTYDRLMK